MTKKSMLILSFLALAMTASAQIDKGDDGFGQRSTTLTMTKKEGKKHAYKPWKSEVIL